jgi:hypothetical protein
MFHLRKSSLFVAIALVALSGIPARSVAEEEPVFSGPQVGEKLPGFEARGVLGDLEGKSFDLVAQADGKPLAIIFVHEVTRPSIGLTRLVMDYAAQRKADGLTAGVVFLTEDATSTEAWIKRASHALPASVPLGISLDGREGPGALGLNRGVTLTVLVAKDSKVTANFALVQPSIEVDAEKIAAAIVDVLGGGDKPTLAQLGVPRQGESAVNLRPVLAPLIQKTATPEDVDRAAAAVERAVADNPAAQRELGRIARTVVNSGKLDNYGTPPAQEYLRKWAEKYGGDQP